MSPPETAGPGVFEFLGQPSANGNGEPTEPTGPVGEVVATFRRWLDMPDPGALYAVLGTVAANLTVGDPVWLLVVGPPGSGKSELVQSVIRLPYVHRAATITEAALLSGTPRKEREASAKGGLLREIGSFGILLCKDFGSVLSMHRDARATVLAALREIFDGSWDRHLGTGGGINLHWEGKCGLIAGCTPSIDSHHAVMGSMGERFVLFRLPPVDEAEQSNRALAHAGREDEMRADLARSVSGLFGTANLGADGHARATVTLSPDDRDGLREVAMLAVRCRSAVERDPYSSREILLIPEPEAPGRLALVLARMLVGIQTTGVAHADAWKVVAKLAFDSMPALRRTVLERLAGDDVPVDTQTIAADAGYPVTTTIRALEDLVAHGVLLRHPQGNTRAVLWSVSQWTRERMEGIEKVFTRNVGTSIYLSSQVR